MSDPNASPVDEASREAPEAKAPNGSFCVYLWRHLRVEGTGAPRVCCAFEGHDVSQAGVPMSVARHSLEEIWNSDMMRSLRRDMAEGRRIVGCRQCYVDEERGGVSMRMRENASFERGWLNEGRVTIGELIALTVDNEFRVPTLPASLEIEVGNLCNFKCRMCSGNASTLIAKDPVHQRWAEDQFSAPYHDPAVPTGFYHFRRASSIEKLGVELGKAPEGEIKRISFIGGEPFLVREVKWLLEALVAAGHAQEIALLFITNGSVVPRWLDLAAKFQRVDLSVSVDGYGEHYNYIRYPGRWSQLTENLGVLREIPNVNVMVTTTLQINNALNITRLFRYLDRIGIDFAGYLLHWPRYLAVSALPLAIRQVGAERLRHYADDDCLAHNRPLVLSLAAQFEGAGDEVDPGVLRDFMLFSNDLDASRGQSIHTTDPELVRLLAECGFPWPDATVHAPAAAPAVGGALRRAGRSGAGASGAGASNIDGRSASLR
jgi:MoaA/NifB/PqqE/SkfB family radical SAM enzyme